MQELQYRERQSFLRQIDAADDDVTPRAIYADWLEERSFPRGDIDVATCEFIRLSCRKPNSRQTAAEDRWLHANWRRLLPTIYGNGHLTKMSSRDSRWCRLQSNR